MKRTVLSAAVGLVLVSVSSANAYWIGLTGKSASGQPIVRALSGNEIIGVEFACDSGRLSFSVRVAASAAPTTQTLSVAIDGGAPEDIQITDSAFTGPRLTITVSASDSADLARRAVAATSSFATSVILDGGKAKFESNQSMTRGREAIGAVLEACKP